MSMDTMDQGRQAGQIRHRTAAQQAVRPEAVRAAIEELEQVQRLAKAAEERADAALGLAEIRYGQMAEAMGLLEEARTSLEAAQNLLESAAQGLGAAEALAALAEADAEAQVQQAELVHEQVGHAEQHLIKARQQQRTRIQESA